MEKVEKELAQLAEDNFRMKSFYEQEKVIADAKIRIESESRMKLEEKLKAYQKIEEQVLEVKRHEDLVQKSLN